MSKYFFDFLYVLPLSSRDFFTFLVALAQGAPCTADTTLHIKAIISMTLSNECFTPNINFDPSI